MNYSSMWKITKSVNRNCITLFVSGYLDNELLVELQNALADEGIGENVVIDLSEVTLIARKAIKFLARCEINRIDLHTCPTYILEWIAQDRREMDTSCKPNPDERVEQSNLGNDLSGDFDPF